MTKTKKILSKRSEAHLPVWERAMNPEQLEAISHENGPLRLLAPAGSGKTRVLAHRVVRLVEHLGVDPSRICAVTFAKKSADEMGERIAHLGCGGVRVGTWHSLCLQILREDRTEWGSWKIDDSNRAKYVLKDVLGWKGMNWVGADSTAVAGFIGRCKADLFQPDSEGALQLAAEVFGAFAGKKATEAFQRYNDALAEKQLLTFDDMLVFAAQHLGIEDNRANWASRWDHVLQDEAQDANFAQVHIASLLARDHRNYMVVGDVYQSIFGFRGSSPKYLAKFDIEWPDARTIWLPRNYRSGRKIIAAANGIVSKARVDGHDPRDMVAERDTDGEVITRSAENLDDEAQNFVGWVRDLVKSGSAKYSDVTCLFRTNAQSRALEEALLGERMPYVVVGGTSFYERKEVRDLLAYLRVATERGEIEDVKRCINSPFRFLGVKFVERVMSAAEGGCDLNWPAIVKDVADGERIQARQKQSAWEWASMIDATAKTARAAQRPEASEDEKTAARPAVLLENIIRETRYIDHITKEEGEDSIENSGAANVREMVRVAERFPTSKELLDYIDETIRSAKTQREDKQAGGQRVLLMSVHRSKGLEWPHVWVAGFNEMILPHVKGDPEEERRLAYVATTRARDTLVLSFVRSLATRAGIKDAFPSRFLADAQLGLEPDDSVLRNPVLDRAKSEEPVPVDSLYVAPAAAEVDA